MKKPFLSLTVFLALSMSVAAQVAAEKTATETERTAPSEVTESQRPSAADIEARLHILGKQMQEQREREGDAFDPAPYERRMAALRARQAELDLPGNN